MGGLPVCLSGDWEKCHKISTYAETIYGRDVFLGPNSGVNT